MALASARNQNSNSCPVNKCTFLSLDSRKPLGQSFSMAQATAPHLHTTEPVLDRTISRLADHADGNHRR